MSTVGEVPGAATPTTPPPAELEVESRRLSGMHRFIAQIRSARGVPKWILYSGIGIVLFFVDPSYIHVFHRSEPKLRRSFAGASMLVESRGCVTLARRVVRLREWHDLGFGRCWF